MKQKKIKTVSVEPLIVKMDVKDLVNLSEIIIEGKVGKTISSDWSKVVKTPLSDTNIKITKVLNVFHYNRK